MPVTDQPLRTSGIVLHSPVLYDFTVWLAFLGIERTFRDKVLRLARLRKGESVLDVGCGTGTLAIAAKLSAGPDTAVSGIDASPEMVVKAQQKARKVGAQVLFRNSLAEALPFPDAEFDLVLSTVMLHHLPRKARLQCAHEIRRVLKPSGRVLAVDFEGATNKEHFSLTFTVLMVMSGYKILLSSWPKQG